MIKLNVDRLLEERKKSRYWLVKQTNSNYQVMNPIVDNEVIQIRLETLEKIMKAFEIEDFNQMFRNEKDIVQEEV